jgi:hypothetical protein
MNSVFEKIAQEAFEDELKKIAFLENVTGGEAAGSLFLSPLTGSIIQATKAKEGKKLRSFGGSLGRQVGYGTLGAFGGAAVGAGLGRIVKGNAEVSATLGARLGMIPGILFGLSQAKKGMKEKGYLLEGHK